MRRKEGETFQGDWRARDGGDDAGQAHRTTQKTELDTVRERKEGGRG